MRLSGKSPAKRNFRRKFFASGWHPRPAHGKVALMHPVAAFTLTGYRHSIYTRIARMVLHAKGATFTEVEVNPFAPPLPDGYPHPFGRVPVLTHGEFTLFETSAIARYIDLACSGPALVPPARKAAARMAQVISIADAYAFKPLVLQVYAHRCFRPAEGLTPDEAQIAAGLVASAPILTTLAAIIDEGLILKDSSLSLADCHLAPMIGAFAAAPEGERQLTKHPTLLDWWHRLQHQTCFVQSGRPLPTPIDPP
jgi:glutathione S-transferase